MDIVKQLTRGHPASQWHGWDLIPGLSDLVISLASESKDACACSQIT